jgi:hypothetical protein
MTSLSFAVWPVKIAKQFCWGYPAKLNFLLSVLCGFAVQNFSFFYDRISGKSY